MNLGWVQIVFVVVTLLPLSKSRYSNHGTGHSGFASVVKQVINNSTVAPSINNTHPKLPDRFRIIGGVETAKYEFPFIVSLARPHHGGHFCGGSIVDPEWILTAAHCASEPDFRVTAGEHDLQMDEGTEQTAKAVMVIRHPHYNPITYEDDICLVKISPPYQFNQHVKPFAIPTAHYVATGNATVAGWGTEDEAFQVVSPVLRKVTVPLVETVECSKQYGHYFLPRKMICAGLEEGGKDACQGDSGGPLMCDDYHKGATLCGVVSFGLGCARPELAGVYTKVTHYRDWIEYEIRRNSFDNNDPQHPPRRTTPHIRRPETTTTKTTTTTTTVAPLQPYIPPRHHPQIPPGYTVVIIKPDKPNNETQNYIPPPPPYVPPYYDRPRHNNKTRIRNCAAISTVSNICLVVLISLVLG